MEGMSGKPNNSNNYYRRASDGCRFPVTGDHLYTFVDQLWLISFVTGTKNSNEVYFFLRFEGRLKGVSQIST